MQDLFFLKLKYTRLRLNRNFRLRQSTIENIIKLGFMTRKYEENKRMNIVRRRFHMTRVSVRSNKQKSLSF